MWWLAALIAFSGDFHHLALIAASGNLLGLPLLASITWLLAVARRHRLFRWDKE
jgi:hypothetical protein